MARGIRFWWATIAAHYGTLEGFSDAPTVRTMRLECLKAAADDAIVVLALSDDEAELARWDACMAEERALVTEVLQACTAWLQNRGLKP